VKTLPRDRQPIPARWVLRSRRVGVACPRRAPRIFLLSQQETFMKLLIKLAVANLLEDLGISSLVDLERFLAVGADDFMHV